MSFSENRWFNVTFLVKNGTSSGYTKFSVNAISLSNPNSNIPAAVFQSYQHQTFRTSLHHHLSSLRKRAPWHLIRCGSSFDILRIQPEAIELKSAADFVTHDVFFFKTGLRTGDITHIELEHNEHNMVLKTMKPTGKSSPAGIFCWTRPKLQVLWVPSDDSSWGVLGLKPPGYPKVLSTESSTERAKNSRARQWRFF